MVGTLEVGQSVTWKSMPSTLMQESNLRVCCLMFMPVTNDESLRIFKKSNHAEIKI